MDSWGGGCPNVCRRGAGAASMRCAGMKGPFHACYLRAQGSHGYITLAGWVQGRGILQQSCALNFHILAQGWGRTNISRSARPPPPPNCSKPFPTAGCEAGSPRRGPRSGGCGGSAGDPALAHWKVRQDRPWPPDLLQSTGLECDVRYYRFGCYLLRFRLSQTLPPLPICRLSHLNSDLTTSAHLKVWDL